MFSNRTTGHVLLVIAALLYASRYMAAAIAVVGKTGSAEVNLRHALEGIGSAPVVLATICSGLGLLTLVRSEWHSSRGDDSE